LRAVNLIARRATVHLEVAVKPRALQALWAPRRLLEFEPGETGVAATVNDLGVVTASNGRALEAPPLVEECDDRTVEPLVGDAIGSTMK
jgi:hypothetical protein